MTTTTRAPRPSALLALGMLALASACATGETSAPPVLVVASPQPAGASVTIDQASMSGPGFVVIHATDAEGKPLVPGAIGASSIPDGQSRNVAVALTEPVAPGDRLIAMLHVDSGQPAVYEFGPSSIAEDKPVMYQGQPVTAPIVLE